MKVSLAVFGDSNFPLDESDFISRAVFGDARAYRYAFLVLAAFSLFYSAGLLLGLGRAAKGIEKRLPGS